jgi:ABC-type uncharacterized transport system auxiliary subunit
MIIALPIFWGSCISNKTVLNKYYLIDFQGVSAGQEDGNGEQPVIDMTCEIEKIEVNLLIDRSQIINRSRSNEITYYQNHLWATRPSVAFAEAILHQLEASSLFRGVSTRYSRDVPDFRFGTTIRQLEVIEEDHDFLAHLQMKFQLIRNADDMVLATHSFDRIEPLPKRDLNIFAQTISQILHEELHIFISQLRQQGPEIQNRADGRN